MVEAGPTSYKAAMASTETDQWEAAVSSEKTSLGEHDVFEFMAQEEVPRPANVIDGK